MSSSTVRISERVLAVGDWSFLRQVVLPASEKVEELAVSYPESPGDSDGIARVEPNPTAFLTELGGVVGVLTFVSGWAASKALDELFDSKVRPLLRNAISGMLKQ